MQLLKRWVEDKSGNFGMLAALAAIGLTLGIGMSIDYSRAVTERDHLQQALDAGLLAAMNKSTLTEQREVIENVLIANLEGSNHISADLISTPTSLSSRTATAASQRRSEIVSKPASCASPDDSLFSSA